LTCESRPTCDDPGETEGCQFARGRTPRLAGLITTRHTAGSSIPGSGAITGDHLLAMHPHVSFHINGGPTAMPDADFERVIKESKIALHGCTAGNLRSMLLCKGIC
jgi:enamidase